MFRYKVISRPLQFASRGECTTALGILSATFLRHPVYLTPFESCSMPSWWQVAYVTNVQKVNLLF